jgi:hypothetical protein
LGAKPVGVAITDDGWVVVTNANRSSPGMVASLAVIDAHALPGSPVSKVGPDQESHRCWEPRHALIPTLIEVRP